MARIIKRTIKRQKGRNWWQRRNEIREKDSMLRLLASIGRKNLLSGLPFILMDKKEPHKVNLEEMIKKNIEKEYDIDVGEVRYFSNFEELPPEVRGELSKRYNSSENKRGYFLAYSPEEERSFFGVTNRRGTKVLKSFEI